MGWPGGIRPRLGALRPERRTVMTVCPPQNHQGRMGLRSQEPGEDYEPSPAENTPLLPEKGNRCRVSGGVARRDPSSTRRSPSRTAGLYDGLSPTKPPTTGDPSIPGPVAGDTKTSAYRPPLWLPSPNPRGRMGSEGLFSAFSALFLVSQPSPPVARLPFSKRTENCHPKIFGDYNGRALKIPKSLFNSNLCLTFSED